MGHPDALNANIVGIFTRKWAVAVILANRAVKVAQPDAPVKVRSG